MNMKTSAAPWVMVKDEDGYHVAPATSFREGRRWFADKVCEGILSEDDARLIAAAPALLDALRDLVDSEEMDTPDCALYRQGLEKARAALAHMADFDKTKDSDGGRRMNEPEMATCAICAAGGLSDVMTPADTAVPIPHDPIRDGAEVRVVYACPECAAQMDPDDMTTNETTPRDPSPFGLRLYARFLGFVLSRPAAHPAVLTTARARNDVPGILAMEDEIAPLLDVLRDLVDSDEMDTPDCALYRQGIEKARAALAKGGV